MVRWGLVQLDTRFWGWWWEGIVFPLLRESAWIHPYGFMWWYLFYRSRSCWPFLQWLFYLVICRICFSFAISPWQILSQMSCSPATQEARWLWWDQEVSEQDLLHQYRCVAWWWGWSKRWGPAQIETPGISLIVWRICSISLLGRLLYGSVAPSEWRS